MPEKMLVLLDIVDGQVIVRGVCNLNRREMANQWAAIDKHRHVEEVEVVS